MARFYEEMGEFKGRRYMSSEGIKQVVSVDVSVGEIHYDLVSPDGTTKRCCGPIASFALLERIAETEINF
jgi:hypothetical protein